MIAWKAEDLEIGVLSVDLLVKLLESFILWSETAFGCAVEDEDYFAFVVGELDWSSLL